jgi:putative ABC transport system permease protein
LPLLTGGNTSKVTVGQENVLAKVLRRLPAALDQLGLSPNEQKAMRQMLQAAKRPAQSESKSAHQEQVFTSSFTIRGVVRGAAEGEPYRREHWIMPHTDLFVPQRHALAIVLSAPEVKERGLSDVVVEVDDMENVKAVQKQIKDMGFRTNSAVDYIEREQLIYLIVFTGMTVVAITALVVAALGITNTMLMSVLERTGEIGIMKAVGGRNGHVLLMFLLEGALIGVVGGLLGLLTGWLVSFPSDAWCRSMVSARLNINLDGSLFAFPWWLVAGAPLFAVLVTVTAALYPARRALRIDPVEALRHE